MKRFHIDTKALGAHVREWLKSFVTHNPWYKLLSLVLALALWAGLIAQDSSITRDKQFTDVTVSVTGADTLKRNGYIVVSDTTELLSGFTVTASVPQLLYESVTINNYNPRIDLSRISGSGTQTVSVVTTSSSTYGSVLSVEPATVELSVEPYVTRYRIPVVVTTTGELPAGFASGTASANPPLITISGPASVVNTVVRGEAVMDLSTLPAQEGTVRTSVPLNLVDAEGNAVDLSQVEITSESVLLDSVIVEQTLYATAQLPVNGTTLITGTPAAGYEVKSVTVEPATVTATGTAAALESLSSILPEAQLDVTGLSSSITMQVNLRKPSELQSLSTTSLSVIIDIGPIETDRTFQSLKVTPIGMASTQTATVNDRVFVRLTGPMNTLNNLTTANLLLTVDVSGL